MKMYLAVWIESFEGSDVTFCYTLFPLVTLSFWFFGLPPSLGFRVVGYLKLSYLE